MHSKTFLLVAISIGFAFALHASPLVWTQSNNNAPTNKQWNAVASSADGTKLVVVSNTGEIYTSADSGSTWVSNSLPGQVWYSVTSSADGAKLVAASYGPPNAKIWASKDSGASWYLTSAPYGGLQNYIAVASSADGMKLVAAGAYAPNRYIYYSSDSGTNWAPTAAPTARSWYYVTCSADGTKLFGVAWNYPSNFTSIDSGASWQSHAMPTNFWVAATSSADGSKITEVGNSSPVYTSTNSGSTWYSNSLPIATWTCATSSSNGNFVAVAGYSVLYTTSDSGQTWVSNNIPHLPWAGIASSADGRKVLAAAYTGQIFTAKPAPLTLTSASGPSGLTLGWPATETNYSLQQTFDLVHGPWTDVTNLASPQDGQQQVTVTPNTNQIFYRLKGN